MDSETVPEPPPLEPPVLMEQTCSCVHTLSAVSGQSLVESMLAHIDYANHDKVN